MTNTLELERRETAAPERSPGGGKSIAFENVSKRFGARVVLRQFDLKIPAGQFVAIVGRSGSGKSTLLRLAVGLDAPSGGTIKIGDERLEGLSPDIRLLFQDARLAPWQRVIGNVGIARGEGWRERALEALAQVGLADRANEWPAVLSGGQKQRVSLARALVSDPSILLLDEPFGALDALTRMDMHKLLEGLWAARSFTAVLITHDIAEAVALADRVLVLRDGNIAADIEVSAARPRMEIADGRLTSIQKEILALV